MKLRRILATTAAAAIATAAMSVAASAADAVTITNEDPFTSDWSADGTVDFANFEAFEGDVLVTVELATIINDEHQDWWSLAPADCNGWGKLTVDTLGNESYFQQSDGFIVLSDSTLTSIQFVLDQDDIASMEATMTPTEDGGWYGGMLFQIAGVDVKSVTLEDYVPASDDAAGSTDGATGEDKNSADTGVEGVAVAAGAVALAGVAVIASRKRK